VRKHLKIPQSSPEGAALREGVWRAAKNLHDG